LVPIQLKAHDNHPDFRQIRIEWDLTDLPEPKRFVKPSGV
jgi:hypothetical protein